MKHFVPIVTLAILFFAGCGDTIEGKSIAELEVVKFHDRLAARQFDEIYFRASGDLKEAVTKEKLIGLLAAIERKLGFAEFTLATCSIPAGKKEVNRKAKQVLQPNRFSRG